MTLTQYLLTKLAEEANEVAMEALKQTQFGIDSQWKGDVAIKELQTELLDLMAVVKFLGNREDVRQVLKGRPLLDMQTTNPEVEERMLAKIQKLSFFALRSNELGHLTLSQSDQRLLSQLGREYIANKPLA